MAARCFIYNWKTVQDNLGRESVRGVLELVP
jgi:hypothetical protein